MKTRNYFILCLFLFASLFISSCSKDGDNKDQLDGSMLPKNQVDAEQKINGKWSLGSSDVKSIEFSGNNTYILEVSSESDLVQFSSATESSFQSLKKSKSASIGTISSLAPSVTQFITGTYSISADGKTVTLDQIAVLTIKALSDTSFNFSITFKESNKTVDITLTSTPTLEATSKTTMLARTWVLTAWPSFYSNEELAELNNKGFKPQDESFTFTISGTFIMNTISMEASTSPIPEHGTPLPTVYTASKETAVGTWKWKNSQENAVIVTINNEEPEEISISNLNSSSITIYQLTYTAK